MKIWKGLKLLNSVPFIKKTLANHAYIRIWHFWLTFTALQWMKKNSKISQIFKFSTKVGVSDIGQNLEMIKTSQFCSMPQENTCKSSLHLNLTFSTDFHSFTVNEENSEISQFSSFLLTSNYAIQVKIWKWLKLLNSVPFIKKTLVNHVYIRIWSSWLTFTALQWMKTNFRICQLEDFCSGPVMRFWSKFDND